MDSQESLPVHHPPHFLLPHHPHQRQQQEQVPSHGHGTMVAPPPPPPQPQPHQHHQQQQEAPPHGHGTMVAPPPPQPQPHQHHHQQQQAPPHGHGTMVAPPPPQPHHQEQPNSYIFQLAQQQNLEIPFNLVSGQNQKSNLDHSNGSSTAPKKKRGRPRKYSADANNLSPTPIAQIPSVLNKADSGGADAGANNAKKARGRPPGSGKKQKQEALGAAGFGFTPHLIPVHIGEDIVSKIMTFSLQGPPAICILSATGAVCNVTLRQSTIGGGTVTYEGRFNIISLSGSFLLSESNGNRSRTGGLSVSLSGPDGRVLGGVVAGMLKAAAPVQLIVGSFIPEKEKLSEAPSSTPPPNMLNFGAPVTEASSPSPGASSDSADDNGGSPLSHEQGPFVNAAQQMHPNAAQLMHPNAAQQMHPNAAQPMHGMPTYWGQAM